MSNAVDSLIVQRRTFYQNKLKEAGIDADTVIVDFKKIAIAFQTEEEYHFFKLSCSAVTF